MMESQNSRITEQDIFNYIFYPDVLETDKKNYLDVHRQDFSEQIDFCIELNKTDNVKEEMLEPAQQQVRIIQLYPVRLSINNNNNQLTLAAGSSELSKRIETKTFTDDNSQFLVRLVAADGEKKLYIFSKNKEFKEAKLTIFPSQKSFRISSFDLPIKIDNLEEIEKISIEDYN